MSFDIPMDMILQYAYNIFASVSPMIYLWVGAAFALYILFAIISAVRRD